MSASGPDGQGLKPAARRGRLNALDGMRFLAAAFVMSYHYLGMPTGWGGRSTQHIFPTAYLPASYGWLGVQLFFLISGFVICMSTWGRNLGDFFISRAVRLYPAYWFGIIATTSVLALWGGVSKPLPWRDILTNLTMLHEPLGLDNVDSVYWTLWAEMRFYLLFAIVVWRGVTYRKAVLFCLLWTVASVVVDQANNQVLTTVINPEYSPYFVGGIAFYLMYRFGPNLMLWGIAGFSFLLAQHQVYSTFYHSERLLGRDLPDWPPFALVALFFVLIAGVALGWFSAIRWKWLTVAGATTYPLYLLHEEIGWAVIRHFGHQVNPGVLVGCLAVAMVFVAWLVHRLIERPVSKVMKRALTKGVEQMRAAAATARG